MAEIHSLKITFEGGLKAGPKPWMWALVDVALQDETEIRPTVQVAVPVPFEGEGVFEMRETAWAAAGRSSRRRSGPATARAPSSFPSAAARRR